MSGEKAVVAELRFPEFEGEWEQRRLGAFLRRLSERVPANTKIPVYSSSREGLKTQEDYFSDRRLANEGEYGVVPDGAITYRHMSDDLTFRFNRNKLGHSIAVSKEYPVFSTEGMDADYLILWLNFSSAFARFAIQQKLGGTRTRLYFKNLSDWQCPIPSLPEQQKIAAFLDAVSEKITLLTQKREALTDYKRGLMQRLFSGALRFNRPDGSAFPDWDEIGAGTLFRSVSNKKHNGDLPILSITQEGGAVLRDDVGIDIKATAASVQSYKIVEPGDFIISLRSFQGGIEYSDVLGICSPAYTILKPTKEIADGFYKQFMKSGDFISRLSLTVVGIRDGKQISYSAFSTLKLPYPHPDEQIKIAEALSALDAKIDAMSAEISQMETFKKGLLQKMFV